MPRKTKTLPSVCRQVLQHQVAMMMISVRFPRDGSFGEVVRAAKRNDVSPSTYIRERMLQIARAENRGIKAPRIERPRRDPNRNTTLY